MLTLAGLLLLGVSTFGAEDPSLSKQLTDLGRQALAQGAVPTARTFFQKAVQLEPTNQAAARALEDIQRTEDSVVRVALQDPAPPQPLLRPNSRPSARPPIPRRPWSRPRRRRTSPGNS